MIACARCGRPPEPPSEEVPFDWMVERDRGRVIGICPACARDNARAIEGKLDQAWW